MGNTPIHDGVLLAVYTITLPTVHWYLGNTICWCPEYLYGIPHLVRWSYLQIATYVTCVCCVYRGHVPLYNSTSNTTLDYWYYTLCMYAYGVVEGVQICHPTMAWHIQQPNTTSSWVRYVRMWGSALLLVLLCTTCSTYARDIQHNGSAYHMYYLNTMTLHLYWYHETPYLRCCEYLYGVCYLVRWSYLQIATYVTLCTAWCSGQHHYMHSTYTVHYAGLLMPHCVPVHMVLLMLSVYHLLCTHTKKTSIHVYVCTHGWCIVILTQHVHYVW